MTYGLQWYPMWCSCASSSTDFNSIQFNSIQLQFNISITVSITLSSSLVDVQSMGSLRIRWEMTIHSYLELHTYLCCVKKVQLTMEESFTTCHAQISIAFVDVVVSHEWIRTPKWFDSMTTLAPATPTQRCPENGESSAFTCQNFRQNSTFIRILKILSQLYSYISLEWVWDFCAPMILNHIQWASKSESAK